MTKAQQTQVERAMELAKKAGHKVYTGKSRLTGETVYTVKSRSQENTYHVLYIRDGRILCDCEAHKQGRICSHAGAVRLHLLEQREALKQVEATDRKDAEEAAQQEQQEITERLLASLTPEEREHREMMDAKMALYGYTWNEAEYRYEYTETVEERNRKAQEAYDARLAANKAMYAQERAEEAAATSAGSGCSLCGGALDQYGVCREGICARYGMKPAQPARDKATAPMVDSGFSLTRVLSFMHPDDDNSPAAWDEAVSNMLHPDGGF